MRGRLLGAIGLLAAIACQDGGNSENAANSKNGGEGNATVGGTVYGMTFAPDSQRVEIAGATITLIRVGDFPAPNPGPDTTGTPSDTLLSIRHGLRSTLDTVVGPPDTTQGPPPPPPNVCQAGTAVATIVSGSDGRWSVEGLQEGVYNAVVEGPTGGKWLGNEYCGFQVFESGTNDLTLYLPESPGPDPMP